MSAYAWSDEPTEPDYAPTGTNRSVVAAFALGAVGLAVACVAAVVTLTSVPRQPDRFEIRPAPVQEIPPPPKPAAPAPKPVQAPPQAAPPAHEQEPPNAHQTFAGALRGDTAQTQGGAGLYPTEPQGTIDSEAQAMCQDLAHGGAIQPYITGTLAKSPSLAPWQAAQVVHQAIDAYCPQYNR
jgi:Protein of unknown function (DUF732)